MIQDLQGQVSAAYEKISLMTRERAELHEEMDQLEQLNVSLKSQLNQTESS
jgi:hypothetical protein